MTSMLLAILALLLVEGQGTPVTFTTIGEGQTSGIEDRKEVVVRTPAEWKKLWAEHAPDQTMPSVDFSKSMVVGVFLGSRTSGGYRATIVSIDSQGTDLLVTWREDRPGRDEIVTQVLTFPFHIVRLAQTPGNVKFRIASPGR
jgi:PrcB C-terminal